MIAALITAAVWTGILIALSEGLQESQRPYRFGVGSAAFAFVIVVLATRLIASVFPETPGWVVFAVLAPLVEESVRLVGADTVHRRSTWPQWLVFGAGYALLESGLKLADALAIAASDLSHQWFRILIPVVPFLLHVFLSALMCLLLQRGASLLAVWVISMVLHALHNWSAVTFVPADIPGFVELLAVRSLVFLALIRGIIYLAKRTETPSPEPA